MSRGEALLSFYQDLGCCCSSAVQAFDVMHVLLHPLSHPTRRPLQRGDCSRQTQERQQQRQRLR